jgi:hypothetical protein
MTVTVMTHQNLGSRKAFGVFIYWNAVSLAALTQSKACGLSAYPEHGFFLRPANEGF